MKNTWKYTFILLFICHFLYAQQTSANQIRVTSSPEGGDVYLDGQRIGKTPMMYSVKTPKDSFYVEVRKQGYRTAKYELYFGSKKIQNIHAKLQDEYKTNSLKYSALFSGAGQIHSGRYTKGLIQAVGFGAGLVLTITKYSSYRDKLDDYETKKQAYIDNTVINMYPDLYDEMQESYKALESEYTMLVVFSGITVISYAWSLYDAYNSRPRPDQPIEIIKIGFTKVQRKPALNFVIHF